MDAAPLRPILHAAARVLACGSVQMALVDEERQALVLRIAVMNRDVPRLAAVESVLGFSPEGAAIPLAADGSLLVRALKEGRLLVTGRFAELAGGLLPDVIAAEVQSVIGDHSFAAVPVVGRAGPIGVLLFEKPGDAGFAPSDRDLLVAYADRVGGAVEAQALTEDVAALESLGDVGAPPPQVLLADAEGASLPILDGEAAGRPLADVIGAAPSLLAEALARARESARPVTIAKAARDSRVTLRFVSPSRIVAVVEAVGWQARLGGALARARDHFTRVLSTIDDALFTVDVDGVVVGCNLAGGAQGTAPSTRPRPRFADAPGELLGRAFVDLLADARSRQRAAEMARRLAADGFAEGELRFLARDDRAARERGARAGTLTAAVSALALADENGREAGAVFRVRDLTERRRGDAERRRLRARLLQSERLSALGEMAARIAHEVRNPLVSISAAARVIEEELAGPAPANVPSLIDDVRAISREARRLDGIVSDFLRFARPRRAQRKPVAVDKVVAETIALVRQKSPSIELLLEAKGAPVIARCDEDGLRQVLWNVLLNAVEASPERAAVECDVRKVGGKVVVAVGDRGPGIAPGVRRRVFDPFFSTKARGTGLGLAVCKQIVEEHHGRVRVLGRAGGGTRVVVELPA